MFIFLQNLNTIIIQWWPWLNLWSDLLFIQFFIVWTLFYIFFYKNVYYTLLYTFINFFLMGLYLSIFQIELFTAFLWLVECSVLFVFLLLLFFLNIKANYIYTYSNFDVAFTRLLRDRADFWEYVWGEGWTRTSDQRLHRRLLCCQ